MYRLLRSFFISLGVICTIASLSPPGPALDDTARHRARPADLEGRAWQISNYFLDKEQTTPYRRIGQKGDAYVSFAEGVLGGSPGCGRFTGTYRKPSAQLTISAQWTDQKEIACGGDEKKNAEQILRTLTSVRRVLVAPAYWHSDALLLADAKGSTQITLSPMQPGKDLSELQDSFWNLAKLEGSRTDLSGVIVKIEKGNISFSTVSYLAMFPFEYNLSGPTFAPPAWHTASADNRQALRDERVARQFHNDLRKSSSYDFSQGTLTFFSKDRQAIVVLNSLQQQGIENRKWRIAKFRGDRSQHGDEEGLIAATEDADITFVHGRVEGSPGCGAWEGTYKISGDRITVQAGWVLAGFCFPAGFAQDRLVEGALKGELRIEKAGDNLLLRDEHGNARILLVPY